MPTRAVAAGSGGGSGATDRFTKAFVAGLAECRAQGSAYGQCVKAHLPDIEKGACEKEFVALERCFTASLRKQLAKSRK